MTKYFKQAGIALLLTSLSPISQTQAALTPITIPYEPMLLSTCLFGGPIASLGGPVIIKLIQKIGFSNKIILTNLAQIVKARTPESAITELKANFANFSEQNQAVLFSIFANQNNAKFFATQDQAAHDKNNEAYAKLLTKLNHYRRSKIAMQACATTGVLLSALYGTLALGLRSGVIIYHDLDLR